MLNYNIIKDFVDELINRRNDVELFTEDYVRYVLICTLRKKSIGINYSIEVPYIRNGKPTKFGLNNTSCFANEKSRLDLCVENGNGNPNDVIEFKFHRKTKYSNNCSTTKAGSVFNDLNRLSIISNSNNRYLVYVFDASMHSSLNHKNSYNAYVISDKFKNGSCARIDTTYHTLNNGKTYSEDFTNRALSSFNDNYKCFSKFSYSVECIFNDGFQVGNDDFWCIVLEVKD